MLLWALEKFEIFIGDVDGDAFRFVGLELTKSLEIYSEKIWLVRNDDEEV